MSSVAEKLQRKDQRQAASRQVRLKLVYIDFWSVVKLSFLIWLCLGIVLIVADRPHLDRAQLDRRLRRTLNETLPDILGDADLPHRELVRPRHRSWSSPSSSRC